MQGRLFDIQRFSLDDGPGIRTVVFMKGCNLSCAWCHNPESIRPETQISKIESLCAKCGRCRSVCAKGAVAGFEAGFQILRERCTMCGACIEACPAESLKQTGYTITPAGVLEVLLKDIDYYKESGGGVTFSGGEPAVQPEFLIETLRLCKEAGLHTAIETNGICAFGLLERLSPLLDYVMLDLKHVNDQEHQKFTGGSCESVKRSVEYYTTHNNTEVRIPVIPGFNETPDELQSILDFLDACAVERATFLPYHTYGVSKYKSLGMKYGLADTPPLSAGDLQHILDRLNTRFISVKISEK